MKKRLLLMAVAVLLTIGQGFIHAGGKAGKLLAGVRHLTQSTVIVNRGQKVIYFDPYRLPEEKHDADAVFVTHPHSDHFSLADIKAALKPGGILVAPKDAAARARSGGIDKTIPVLPGKEYEAAGLRFTTVPAYNLNKGYHPKSMNWVGYLVRLGDVTFYFAGDTDLIPEMKGIKADVAFLPVGGIYTMNAEEAAQAANLIKPAVAVPVHFYDLVGTTADAQKFVSLLAEGIEGVILRHVE